jgi:hypothetical protein
MPFIGNQPALAYTSFAVQHFTTSATTSYTLDYPVANENEIRLVINNVVQQPGSSYAYTASGTSLTLSAATTVSDTMYAVFLGKAVQTVNPPNSSVGASQLADGAVTSAKLASGVGGKLLQVVTATDSTARTTTSTSFVTASNTLSVTLTPASTSSKVFVIATGAIYIAGGSTYAKATIYRGATNLGSADGMSNTYDGGDDNSSGMSLSILDSPNTTSATTYQVYILTNASSTAYLNVNGAKGSITAFEIAG